MMNKSRSLLLLSVLAVLFAACEEGIIDNAILSQDYTEPEYSIALSPGELSFPAEGGEEDITLELTRSLSWTATTNDSWITLPTHSGDDSPTSVIHILVAENTSLENRIGTITFKTRGKTATLTVRQEGVEPFLSTDVQTLTFPSDGGAQQVQISTNGNWTATTKSESAFSVSPASGTGEGTLTVTAAENETTVLRWETLTLTSGALTVSITLLQQAKPDLNGHAYVNLALPSGLLWATCNVGASTPEEYGDYFAWGETAKKNSYTWANYKWSDGSMQSLTKYNNRNDYGIVDNLSELLPSDDAAVVNWGGCWRMPTHAEWEELCNTDNCTWTPMNNNGQCEGYKVTSTRNGNSIFLPSAGLYTESGLDRANLNGYFWASTLFSAPDQGCGLYFDDAGHPHAFSRYQGLSVRPVGKMTLHFSLTPTTINFPATSSSETLSVTANQPWTATTSDVWLTLSNTSGEGDATLSLTAEENTSITSRTGTVTFQTGATTYTVSVTQEGATPTFNVSPESLSFTAEGGNETITVTSNLSWTVTSSDAWLTVSSSSGEGDATLTVVAQENTFTSSRSGILTFKGKDITFTVNVTQEGASPAFSVTPTTLSFTSSGGNQSVSITSNLSWTASFNDSWLSLSNSSGEGDATLSITAQANTSTDNRAGTVTFTAGGKTYSVTIIQDGVATHFDVTPTTLAFTSKGGSKSVSVMSNQPWTVSSDVSWLKLSNSSGTSDATLSVTAEENTSTSSRAGTVTFKVGDRNYTVSITQEGADPFFNIAPETLSFASSGESKSVSITSNISWTASSNVSWLTLSKSAGEGDATLSLTVEENTSISNRSGTVTFKANGKDYTVSITQAGATPTFSITPTTLSFTSSGGNQSITVTSNQTWTASSSVSWLTLSKTSGTGDATVSVSAQANTSTDNRSGIVTFTAGGKTYTVSVTQEGVPTYFEVSPTTLSFSASGGSKSISVMSNQPWTVSADASWLKLSDNSGTSDATLSVTAEENTTTSSRSGTITFKAGGNTYSVSVTQEEANPTFSVTPEALSFTASGGNQSVSVASNQAWTALTSDAWITLSGTSGTGDATLTITAQANKSAGNRTGTITFNAGGTSKTVSVTQEGVEAAKAYLTFEALESTTFTFSQNDLQYSLDGGATWKNISAGRTSPTIQPGERIMWKASGLTPQIDIGIGTFNSSGRFNVEGNIMSLLFGDDFVGKTSLNGKRCAFYGLFLNCTNIVNASKLILPATTLYQECYLKMFQGCTSLTTAPSLPATTLAVCCYREMFRDCTSLIDAPELPATTLASQCYYWMFYGCTSLTTAPELPATTLAEYCYARMFDGCTNLTIASALPATTLANHCYAGMFKGCTNLTTAPELPATKLAKECYRYMFDGCAILNYIKCLATDVSAGECTTGWVQNVASSGTFVKNAAMSSWVTGENGIPNGWTVQNADGTIPGEKKPYLTFEALESTTFSFSKNALQYSLDSGATWTTLPAGTATPTLQAGDRIMWKAELTPNSSGIGSFSSTGRFNAEGNIMSLLYGDNFVGQTSLNGKYSAFYRLFNNSKVVNAGNLVLPATTLADCCYFEMFSGCTSLTTAPELPATTLDYGCYYEMFWNCTSLTTAPELPATTLANQCYNRMFYGCTSLTTAPELPATTLDICCYYEMFWNCTSLTTAPELPATTLADDCYYRMFSGCTSLTMAPELPANSLANECYRLMFYGCTKLTTAPELPATTLADFCYAGMFSECTRLNYIKCLATDISKDHCTTDWVKGVASSGIFVKNASMTGWTTGDSGTPSGWTVQNAN